MLWCPVMKAARSKVASEAAGTGGQEEDELVTEEDEAHHNPLGHEVEDVLETGQHLVIVIPRLGGGEGVADKEDHKVANREPLENSGDPEP